ncbi:MAG: hypothetical protein ACRDQB_14590, partial [Thermocrispum sp.]
QRGRTRVHGLVAADGLHIAEADGEHARRIARQRGIGLLRVDCWAGGDGGLVAYYTGQGFTPTERFTVGDWPGQVLARRLAQPAVS